MQHKTKQSPGLSAWLVQLTARTYDKVAIVALANKLARMAWAVLAKMRLIGHRYCLLLPQFDWPAHDAWTSTRLGNRSRDSHICRPATTTDSMCYMT
jgi:hypothetical protein